MKHYLYLGFILIFGALALFYFNRFPQAQILSIFLTAVFYVFWGVIHHHYKGDLHPRIILEYAGIALLGFLMIYALVFRV